MKKLKLLLSIISGFLFLISFPPLSLGFFAPIALSIMLWISLNSKPKEAFKYFFIFGIVFNTALLYWIPRLMQTGLYAVLVIGMALLISYMSLWYSLVGLSISTIAKKSKTVALIFFPIVWTAQDKLREMGEMSFPWVTTGYTYGNYLNIIQSLSIFGVHFYTFLIATTSVAIYLLYVNKNSKEKVIKISILMLVIYLALFIFGINRRSNINKDSKTLKIALIQPNVDQNVKWKRAFTDSVVNLHLEMSKEAAKDGAEMLLWAESALPCYFLKRTKYRFQVMRLSDSLNIPICFGSLDYTRNSEDLKKHNFFNSVFYYKNNSRRFEKYDKMRLVPFAERLPFENMFPIISSVDLGESDFTPGKEAKVFSEHKFFTPICYEVVYPNHIRKYVSNGGKLMFHVTNDGWFGRSGMPSQHANITKFRTIENGLPTARCANTGISLFYDAYGNTIAKTNIYESKILTRKLNLSSTKTFYSIHGDIFGNISLFMATFYFLIYAGKVIWKRKLK